MLIMGEAVHVWERRAYRDSLHFLQFFCEPKATLQKYSLLIEKKTETQTKYINNIVP